MLLITVPGTELYDEETETFHTDGDFDLHLEHSLISLSKWESKYQKSFLDSENKSPEEFLGYIQAMILDVEYPPDLFTRLTRDNLKSIVAYIESKESATTFKNAATPKHRTETITSELIYYWMVAFQIPFTCETWHLNRLLALVQICNIKNNPGKKMSAREIAARNRDLNAQRKAQYGTSG